MNSSLDIIRAIGSPFDKNSEWSYRESEIQRLLDYATLNKVELLFLEAVKTYGTLGELKSVYQAKKHRYLETLVTAQRVASLFEEAQVDYALYKTVKPFPITPNDVDVLLFGDEGEQERAVVVLREAGFSTIGVAPLQTCMYDTRDGGQGSHDKQGGIYYVDLYREASASYVIYLSKELLEAELRLVETPTCNRQVRTLRPEADLLATLAHSVFPEQLYTLNDYFTTLYYLAQMGAEENARFVKMVRESSVEYAVRSSLGITAVLHKRAYGQVPSGLEVLLEALSGPTRETLRFTKKSSSTPYRYSMLAVTAFLLERAGEVQGRRSIMKQLTNMWRPQFTRYILQVAIERRRRKSY